MEILRQDYLDTLMASKDKNDTVKVLVGMRRVGKSTVLDQFRRLLLDQGISEKSLYYVNLDLIVDDISAKDLESLMTPTLERKGQHYILIDEVQDVDGWEKVIAMLVARKDCDIYITGSSSKMLSSELSTKLSGRHMEINILPLSFKEFIELHPGDRYERFDDYLRCGSLPVVDPEREQAIIDGIIEGVFNTVMIKDVLTHIKGDVKKLMPICRFLYSNIGNVTNIDKIAKGVHISNETTDRYMDALQSAFLFYYADRYDIVGKEILNSKGKYYATDLGMRRVILKGINATDISKPIENIVFMELKRRGYMIRIGSFKDKEIDFTCFKGDSIEYFQVTETMMSEDTRKRELSGLEGIKDNHSKTILTLDRLGLGDHDGIKIVNLIDWLLGR